MLDSLFPDLFPSHLSSFHLCCFSSIHSSANPAQPEEHSPSPPLSPLSDLIRFVVQCCSRCDYMPEVPLDGLALAQLRRRVSLQAILNTVRKPPFFLRRIHGYTVRIVTTAFHDSLPSIFLMIIVSERSHPTTALRPSPCLENREHIRVYWTEYLSRCVCVCFFFYFMKLISS